LRVIIGKKEEKKGGHHDRATVPVQDQDGTDLHKHGRIHLRLCGCRRDKVDADVLAVLMLVHVSPHLGRRTGGLEVLSQQLSGHERRVGEHAVEALRASPPVDSIPTEAGSGAND
jgi:hypothetical protein